MLAMAGTVVYCDEIGSTPAAATFFWRWKTILGFNRGYITVVDYASAEGVTLNI